MSGDIDYSAPPVKQAEPQRGQEPAKGLTIEDVRTMSAAQIAENWDKVAPVLGAQEGGNTHDPFAYRNKEAK